jgi:hypothetical protein
MQMVEVVRYRLVERRRFSINNDVKMSRILAIRSRRRDSHIAQPEIDLQFGRDLGPILKIDEIDLRARPRGSGASGFPSWASAAPVTIMPPNRTTATEHAAWPRHFSMLLCCAPFVHPRAI